MARGKQNTNEPTAQAHDAASLRLVKYPSTPYLPWSPNRAGKEGKVKKRGADGGQDVYLKNVDHFAGMEVVVTAKLDGENATLYSNYYHARSLDGRHHVSRDWIKGFHAQVAWSIPEGWRVCGENMYAKHSIEYDKLPSYFLAFSVWDENNNALSWDETKAFCLERGIEVVPEIWRGTFDEKTLEDLWPIAPQYGEDEAEGYVVRNTEGFARADFMQNIAKAVREGHVQTDQNWMTQAVVPNKVDKLDR